MRGDYIKITHYLNSVKKETWDSWLCIYLVSTVLSAFIFAGFVLTCILMHSSMMDFMINSSLLEGMIYIFIGGMYVLQFSVILGCYLECFGIRVRACDCESCMKERCKDETISS